MQLGVLVDERFSLASEVIGIQLVVGQLAGHAHQLFLALQQAQAQLLLGVFDIAVDRFLFALQLF